MTHLSLDDRGRLTTGASMWETADAPGVPSFKMADGPMGIASGRVDERDLSVLTPCGVALGASWDVDLVRRVGAVVGAEARKFGVNAVLAPNLNMPRSPLTGRAFEMYSEDPYLTGRLGAAWITGLQAAGAGAVAKHLVCNDSETLRDRYDAVVDERTLREIYLKPFELARQAGCAGMLMAYNKLNGTYCVEHHGLITAILKREWGFDGFTVSDWFGTKDTIASAIGGLDLEMPGPARVFGARFAEVVETGVVPEARLVDASDRVADAAQRLAEMPAATIDEVDVRSLLCEAAAGGMVLLKNENDLLPLVAGRHRQIALIGPNAAAPAFQGGTFAKIAVRPDAPTPVEAVAAHYAGRTNIVFAPGVDPQPRLPGMRVRPTGSSGERGMTVEFFGDHAMTTPLASETRNTNSLTWFSEMPGIGAIDRSAAIRASGLYTPEHDGEHLLYIGGTGSVRLLVDGVEMYSQATEIEPGDLMGILKAGDAAHVAVPLKAGVAIEIACELRFEPARAHGFWYGVRAPGTPEQMLADAVSLARESDAVVLVVGESADSGVESRDRTTTSLEPAQVDLIRQVCAANPRTVIVANVAHAFDTSWDNLAPALLITWFAGQEFGPALAEVLAGDREPGGRLPVTIAMTDADYPVLSLTPEETGDLPYAERLGLGYRGFRVPPRHPFGAGLGYAHCVLDDAVHDPAGGGIMVTVSNRSDRVGKAVVQVYAADRPVLAGFAAVVIEPRRSVTVPVQLDPRAFQMWDVDAHRWTDQRGERVLRVGFSSADTPITLS